ncbi:ATP-binding protein [Sphingomonas sp. KR1UV-12]|uniref:histidine kinase n=1 Tax=Sphingomonas aurea TaxID=3063994 RepID=A0ABT9EHZ6_9SPHN|nr:ATP-binding protein [Sphingomonas sp. KR1UV-12]MDP1026590.1 ATP-binding protein [Sphingomonas sp. KR1UV-12]
MLATPYPALALAAATSAAVFLVTGAWEGLALALVGGVAAVLLGRRRDVVMDVAPPPAPAAPTLAEMLDGVADPVLLVSNGRVSIANAAARNVLGTHVIGEDARVAIRHPAAAQALAAADGHPVELVGIGSRDRRWEMRVTAISPDLAIANLVDRTQHAAAERMRVDFVANASHELRTPLASIMGYIETLGEEAGEEPVLRTRFLKIMMDEARRMQRLVEDLLSLSRIEADKYRLPDRLVDVADLLDEVCAELRGSGRARAADLICAEWDNLPPVAGDRAQLSQLFHNLIGNAMKYGRSGTPVTVTLKAVPTGLVMTVTDEGEGIAPEHLPRLTERFYRVDAGRSRALGGTGLGLAIVKHIAERHRGRLDIASRVGVGTTVSVTLPATG